MCRLPVKCLNKVQIFPKMFCGIMTLQIRPYFGQANVGGGGISVLQTPALVNVGLSERAPYCGCIFNLRAVQCLVCSCADCCVL